MHILIIPSEEYIPERNPIAGIFQHDQAKILNEKGNKIGALSFSFKYSFFSLLKAVFGKKNNSTKHISSLKAIGLLFKKIVVPKKASLTHHQIDRINVLRCDGFWGIINSKLPLSHYNLWLNYGKYAFNTYVKEYGKPDLIHAHNVIYAGLLTSFLKEKYNIPIVITEHSSQYAMEDISKELAIKIKAVLNKENKLFAVSPQLIKLLEDKFKLPTHKVKWLPNVLDPTIEATPFNIKNTTQKVRFLNVANLIPLKGQEELIRAFAKVFQNTENAELIIAGEGSLKNHLNHLIETLKLTDKVKLIGFINRQEVIKQMDECTIFVLPSHYETFGVVLIEALSRGIPVISTYCGGPECIVNEKNGILVSIKNIDKLSEALLKMYNNHKNFDSLTLRNELIKAYGKEAFYQKVIAIYKEAIAL